MSESEEQLLDLDIKETSPAKKKVAKKKAAKKAAKKKVAKKKVARATSEEPAAPAVEKPVPEKEDIPQTFSASPEDMDDYGDKETRSEKKEEKPKVEEVTPAANGKPNHGKDGHKQNHPQQNHQGGHHNNNRNKHHQNKKKKKGQHPNQPNQQKKKNPQHNNPNQNKKKGGGNYAQVGRGPSFGYAKGEEVIKPSFESLVEWEVFKSEEGLQTVVDNVSSPENPPIQFNELYQAKLEDLEAVIRERELEVQGAPNRKKLLKLILNNARKTKTPIIAKGVVELMEAGYGFLVYECDNYRIKTESTFINKHLINRHGLKRGHELEVLVSAPKENETCPFVIQINAVNNLKKEEVAHLTPFTELVPYYPLERMLMETDVEKPNWDNFSMRIVDLLTPIGLGQRGLIVAPPRTGKTVLLQSMANAICINQPNIHLIILLVDERPEEVTDFRRQVPGAEVISSTFDESAESHVHAAEMVIEKSRRMVEAGQHVVILLDSITRLARAYNTVMPSSGKILSGGVEAGALQKPKRFFGSARNIEGGGSLTILGTALVETGSKMDEVIFEEFKGTGNMELHLDRELSNKRIYPALSFEKSGTRKEELLYHPDEMNKVYSLRRAMKGVPSTEAMEMLILRVKKTRNNAEFLMAMNR